MTSETEIREQVEADFASMEEALASKNPGILDVLQVYGNYEVAIRQAESYLTALAPRSLFSTTDRSA